MWILLLSLENKCPVYFSLFVCLNLPIAHKKEVADNNCVYRNEVHHSVGERTQVLQDVAADPTLPRTKSVRCTQCNHGEAVFFQVTFNLRFTEASCISPMNCHLA
ncbi:hypothetical protein KSS87_023656 [Heliosperma pusillum]|nr:hypothetical protein KSS87_023656 [Heliosperma pusillum]